MARRKPAERVMTTEQLLAENTALRTMVETQASQLATCQLNLGKRDERLLRLERDNKALEEDRDRHQSLAASRLSDLERLRQDLARANGYIDRILDNEAEPETVQIGNLAREAKPPRGPKLSVNHDGYGSVADRERVLGWRNRP